MKRHLCSLYLITLIALASAQTLAGAIIIINPAFDMPGSVASVTNTPAAQSVTIPGWTLVAPGGTGSHPARVEAGSATFGEGGNVVRLQGNAYIHTTAVDRPTATTGQEYAYSFQLYNASTGSINTGAFLQWFDPNGVLISNTGLLTPSLSAGATGTYSGTAVAPVGTASVGFLLSSTYSPFRTIYANEFSLTVVPEPSAFALTGLAALFLAGHRRRPQAVRDR